MLSRRNIRIKVMQTLYSMNRDAALTLDTAKRQFYRSIELSYNTYLLNVIQFMKVAEYAKKDAAIRKTKHLPTEEDINFIPKLRNNPIVNAISDNERFIRYVKNRKLVARLDNAITRKLYNEFAKTEEYKAYLAQSDSQFKDHQKILLELYKFIAKSELFGEFMDDFTPCWEDDQSLVVGTMKKTIKGLPRNQEFFLDFLPDKETTEEFGEDLMYRLVHKDDELLQIIEPKLKNWEADRVAIIDMIILKMALCELLYFPTIPTKVTINEYIDLSKMYSTPKSKSFINGVLDRLLKELKKQGKINKEGRGLID